MKERLKRLLKRSPAIYHFAEKSYSTLSLNLRRVRLGLLGTKTLEKEWAARHLRESKGDDWGNGSSDWIKGYWNSVNHPHRPFLIEAISRFNPSSILEIGCNCGPNLYLLAKKLPDADIRGIDINPEAIQKGNEWFAQEGITNVKLLAGKADELEQFQDKSFDIVFTDAVLIYVGPDKIQKVVHEMLHVACRALILVEWHCFEPYHKDPNGLGIYYAGNWKRNYVALFKQFVPEEQIHVTKITNDIWPEKNWKEVGATIQVVIEYPSN